MVCIIWLVSDWMVLLRRWTKATGTHNGSSIHIPRRVILILADMSVITLEYLQYRFYIRSLQHLLLIPAPIWLCQQICSGQPYPTFGHKPRHSTFVYLEHRLHPLLQQFGRISLARSPIHLWCPPLEIINKHLDESFAVLMKQRFAPKQTTSLIHLSEGHDGAGPHIDMLMIELLEGKSRTPPL